jgi:hypothetical protein
MDAFCMQMIKYHPDDQGVFSAIAPGMALPPTSLWSNAGNDTTSQRQRDELLGVGPLGASALRVKVADARDFVNGRNFAAYLGMAPGHRGTGGKVKIGKIRRGHDRYLRQLLIHGARAVVQHLGDKQDPRVAGYVVSWSDAALTLLWWHRHIRTPARLGQYWRGNKRCKADQL